MPDSQDSRMPTSLADLVKLYMTQFGSLTFGTVTLVIVWMCMVKPQLEMNQKTTDAQREVLENLHELSESLQGSANHIKQTSDLLDRIVLRQSK